MLKSDETSNQEEVQYLNKKFQTEADKARVINRLNELQPTQDIVEPTKPILPIVIDTILAILGIIIIYKIYRKIFPSTVQIAGKRVLNKLIR